MIKQMLNEFSLLSLTELKTTYDLNDTVSLLPKKKYSCTGEYPYEKQPIKSNRLLINITCGELLIKKSGLVQGSPLFLSCTFGSIYL